MICSSDIIAFMPLVSPADQQRLRESFVELKRPVRLLFFTQALGCETCLDARQILDELPPLSDKISSLPCCLPIPQAVHPPWRAF